MSTLRHSMSGTPQYHAWVAMRARCNNPNDAAYANYGGRGIGVCERWSVFENFFEDMGPRPARFQLDRVDNDGDYTPDNCRWVAQRDNLNNKRTSHVIEHGGERLTVSQWAERLGIHPRTLFNRIHRGWAIDRALSAPVAS